LQIIIIQKKIDLGAFFFDEIGIDEELFLWAPETGARNKTRNETESLKKVGGNRALRTLDSKSNELKESKNNVIRTENPDIRTDSPDNLKDNEMTTKDHGIEVKSGSSVAPESSSRFDEVPETTTPTATTTTASTAAIIWPV
jgi:hypothetical protein